MNDYEGDADGVPWADPQIQKDYEAALGDFLVRFNRIQNTISDLVHYVLVKHRRLDLAAPIIKRPLHQRLDSLELLLLPFTKAVTPPFAAIKKLAEDRNALAHGHFDQNPFQGDYQIVGRGRAEGWTPATISDLAKRADELWDALRSTEAWFQFEEVVD